MFLINLRGGGQLKRPQKRPPNLSVKKLHSMPIRKKDRSFEEMLREIQVDEVPVEYIDFIKVYLDDGSEIIFRQNELIGMKNSGDILELAKLQECIDRIVDFEVMMNSDLVKSKVTRFVGALLATHFSQE
jgi:hypothetical protein